MTTSTYQHSGCSTCVKSDVVGHSASLVAVLKTSSGRRRYEGMDIEVFGVASPGSGSEVDWLECISAIELDNGLVYFCDAAHGENCADVEVKSELRTDFPAGTFLYSITAFNPRNRVTNRIFNELANHKLYVDLKKNLPGCKIYRNFSYFPSRPFHFERGFTIQVPPNYVPYNHDMIIYSLAVKYEQAAFFKGVVVEAGLTVPYVVLAEGMYTEIKEKLVSIRQVPSHPAFLHKANNALFQNIEDVLHMLYQTKDHISLCDELYQVCLENMGSPPTSTERNYPVIEIEGVSSEEVALKTSQLMNAELSNNTPPCLAKLKEKFRCSTMLMAAFKTISDYMQAIEIAEKAKNSIVIVYKYWCNTAASILADEVMKGRSNLPPRSHEVYQWPSNLLRPDKVVLLQTKSGKAMRNDRWRLKTCTLKRMRDSNWITVPMVTSRSMDLIPTLVVDKLKSFSIAQLDIVDHLCPATMPAPPSVVASLAGDAIEDRLHLCQQDEATLDGKPFWW